MAGYQLFLNFPEKNKPNRKHKARKNDHRSTKDLFTVLLIRKMKANCVSTYRLKAPSLHF